MLSECEASVWTRYSVPTEILALLGMRNREHHRVQRVIKLGNVPILVD